MLRVNLLAELHPRRPICWASGRAMRQRIGVCRLPQLPLSEGFVKWTSEAQIICDGSRIFGASASIEQKKRISRFRFCALVGAAAGPMDRYRSLIDERKPGRWTPTAGRAASFTEHPFSEANSTCGFSERAQGASIRRPRFTSENAKPGRRGRSPVDLIGQYRDGS